MRAVAAPDCSPETSRPHFEQKWTPGASAAPQRAQLFWAVMVEGGALRI
jgi:hypothetical protein